MESPNKNRSLDDPFYALLAKNLKGANAGDVKSHRWVVDHFCASKIERAKAGDAESGEWLLRQFCATVRNSRSIQAKHTQFNEDLLVYVANAFIQILNDKPPKEALGIAKKSGHPAIPDKFHRDVKICAEILKHLGSDENMTIADAKVEATKSLRMIRDSRATVDRAWKNNDAKAAAMEFPESDWA